MSPGFSLAALVLTWVALTCIVTVTGYLPLKPSLDEEDCQDVTTLYREDLDVKNFQESLANPLYYRYLKVDPESNFLFVGAMNKLFGLYLKNINITTKVPRIAQDFRPVNTDKDKCRKNGKSENFDCQGHIRFFARLNDPMSPNRFYMCSTGSFKPTGYVLEMKTNNFNMMQSIEAPGICSPDPNDNSTALLVDMPDNTPTLFAGAVRDFLMSDPVISKRQYKETNSKEIVRTKKKSTWLNEPQFVGSFEVGEHVFFFYREVAIEHTNCGKKIFSRVARVCKDDSGGQDHFLKTTWMSFMKARLNCSIPGEYPYYFDEIQDVYRIGDMFYALFTTNVNGLTASAICGYNLTNMNTVFNDSNFKQGNSTSIWFPVPENEVPNPRPGTCGLGSGNQFMARQQFVTQHSMFMDKAVLHQFRKPIFFKSNTLLRKLVVIPNVAGSNGMVFFTASNTGVIYKIAAWPQINPKYDPPTTHLVSKLVPVKQTQPIWSLVHHENSIYYSTDTEVGQLPVETCEKYTKIDLCIQDPYCGWDKALGECNSGSFSPNIIHYTGIDLLSYSLEEAIEKAVDGDLFTHEEISKITGSSVKLRVTYKLQITGNVKWTKESSTLRGDRHTLAQDNSLIITDIRKPDEGVYTATDSKNRVVAQYTLKVDINKEQIEQRWMRKFDQWCEEFARYQDDIRQWEKKCTACCEESSRANMLSAVGGR